MTNFKAPSAPRSLPFQGAWRTPPHALPNRRSRYPLTMNAMNMTQLKAGNSVRALRTIWSM